MAQSLIIVDKLADWPYSIQDTQVVTAKQYLDPPDDMDGKPARIVNLCRSYRYQSIGYYVSLLAKARNHKVYPGITTIQDIKSLAISRVLSDDIDELIQSSLRKLKDDHFTLSVYFGKNLAAHYDKLSSKLFALFPAPLLRAQFVFKKKWLLQDISPVAICDVPEHHQPYLNKFAELYFARKRITAYRKQIAAYDLAILVNPEEETPPSNEKAIELFVAAGEKLNCHVELITKDDYDRLREFDGLFIRVTTAVNHYSYRFSRRAHAEGLVVIDDPDSIVKCTNKVYLTELLHKAHVSVPKSMIIHKDNHKHVVDKFGFPCVLKLPDSAFSLGVVKAHSKEDLQEKMNHFFERSELIIAQEFLPTDFDWRIGVMNRKLLFACKYFMAKDHWQIYDWAQKTKNADNEYYGSVQTVPLDDVPPEVLKTALRAANLIGDGLYGVDLKQIGKQVYVIEINDNPSIDYGLEDALLQGELYLDIMRSFIGRIDAIRGRQLPKEATNHSHREVSAL
jgi:glutathione synthase/RimK-type ligase-like ATP-grasp enzyme